eukprot:GSChrysophyteH1.ASY1.ANO1.16.1 assembled CDS
MSEFSIEVSSSISAKERGDELRSLLAQREALELEADAIGSELLAPTSDGGKPAGIKDPLVDQDGFPRADIDIYRVKSLRGRLAVINTDHKALMEKLTKLTHTMHQAADTIGNSTSSSKQTGSNFSIGATGSTDCTVANLSIKLAYATVDEILPNSPAEEAGLQNGDLLVCFGDISIDADATGNKAEASSKALSRIPGVVREVHRSNQSVTLVVRRAAVDNLLHLSLTPAVWEGRGLLGLHLTPLQ